MDKSAWKKYRIVSCVAAIFGALSSVALAMFFCATVHRGGGIVLYTIGDVVGLQSRDQTGGGKWYSFPQYNSGMVSMRVGETVWEISITRDSTMRLLDGVEFYKGLGQD